MLAAKPMRAINGFLENGRFTPYEPVSLPKRAAVVVVFGEIEDDEDKANRMAFLREMEELREAARGEELPDFPRSSFARQLVDLSDEG